MQQSAGAPGGHAGRNMSEGARRARRIAPHLGRLTVNHARIVSTFAAAGGKAVQVDGSDDLTLSDCVLVSSVPAATSIDGSAPVKVRLYGSTMANKAEDGNVTLLTGGARFEVDANVR